MKPLAALLCLLTVLTATSCMPMPAPSAPRTNVPFTAHELYPEGVAFDPATGGFFVSSLRYGTIGRVSLDGTYQPFTEAGPLVSTQGIAVDTARGRLLVVGGDLGVGERSSEATQERQAGVAVYDLGTGILQRYVALDALTPGRHHANDLALDADGNAYITDSFAGVVYRVTAEGEAAVFAQDEAFASENVGLNGIAVHPDGFLLVAHSGDGRLFRVDLRDPRRVAPVALPEALVGADGLVLLDDRSLVVVQNERHDRTLLLRSGDGWRSASVTAAVPSVLPFPTTATRAGGAVYVLNAKLEELFDPAATRSSDFLLQRVTFGGR
jgi:sugar lactone lactonase YvrE